MARPRTVSRPLILVSVMYQYLSIAFVIAALLIGETRQCRGFDGGSQQEYFARLIRDSKEQKGNEKENALRMIAAQLRGNYEQISTLSGVYRFCDQTRFDDRPRMNAKRMGEVAPEEIYGFPRPDLSNGQESYWEITVGKAAFSWDRGAEKYRVFYEPEELVEFVDATSGELYHAVKGASILWMDAPDASYEFEMSGRQGQLADFEQLDFIDQTGGRIAFKRAKNVLDHNGKFFDVRKFFGEGSRAYHRNVEMYLNCLAGKHGEKAKNFVDEYVSIFYSPVRQQYVLHAEMREGMVSCTIFDGNVGFHATEYAVFFPNGKIHRFRKVHYEPEGDVYIPASGVLQTYHEADDDSLLVSSRYLKKVSQSVNESIEKIEFSGETVGMTYGDRFVDEIENELYVFDDQIGMVPAAEFKFDPLRLAGGGNK